MKPIDEMSAFEACALLRQSVVGDGRPDDRWRMKAFAFVGRRAALRWARVSLRHARIALELGEGVEAIGWLQAAERWRDIAHDYPGRSSRVLEAGTIARVVKAEERRASRILRSWGGR